jgi:hypothetical protein
LFLFLSSIFIGFLLSAWIRNCVAGQISHCSQISDNTSFGSTISIQHSLLNRLNYHRIISQSVGENYYLIYGIDFIVMALERSINDETTNEDAEKPKIALIETCEKQPFTLDNNA